MSAPKGNQFWKLRNKHGEASVLLLLNSCGKQPVSILPIVTGLHGK